MKLVCNIVKHQQCFFHHCNLLPSFIFCPAVPAMHNTILKPRMPEMHLPINWTDGREGVGEPINATKSYQFSRKAKNACNNLHHTRDSKYLLSHLSAIVSHLPGGHFPPPKFGHLPPPNSDISHPKKKTFAGRTTATPIFFSFLAHFSWLFDLQLMEDKNVG